jgi:hypothetical protein
VRNQNAGIIIHKTDGKVIVEAFEATPRHRDILRTSGRLVRYFPGNAASFPNSRLQDESFRGILVDNICQLNEEDVTPFAWGRASSQPDADDDEVARTFATPTEQSKSNSAHPALVTELLINIIAGTGSHEPRRILRKHCHEEVFSGTRKMPWTRSPLWIVYRVAVQRMLSILGPDIDDHSLYKNFAVFSLARLLPGAVGIGDLEYPLTVKVARRLHKLGSSVIDSVLKFSKSVLKLRTDSMRAKFTRAHQAELSKQSVPTFPITLDWEQATFNAESLVNDIKAARSRKPDEPNFTRTKLMAPARLVINNSGK